MKVLVDTNVVLDVLLKRTPFYNDSFIVFRLANSSYINGFLSAVSMTNTFYLLQKTEKSFDEVYQNMDDISRIFKIAPITETSVTAALALRWKDFEDAIQYIAAKEGKADFIITRNKEDFEATDIPCVSPTEFITYLKEKEESA
jgi:predicted nucleic acid-binding protein